MKIYVTSRFKDSNKQDVEALCLAVRSAGMQDFSFIRDVENYQKVFNDPKELWRRSKEEIVKCDALLIDVSDYPSGGRVIEVGMAYALNMPIIVIKRKGVEHKEIYDGIGSKLIVYKNYDDVTKGLAEE